MEYMIDEHGSMQLLKFHYYSILYSLEIIIRALIGNKVANHLLFNFCFSMVFFLSLPLIILQFRL
jgi:hypothetical protein